ncbi:integrase core domain-containing protein [Microbacterium capsulatum]|uniref:integrase core domain-containing protein n=1 Tax=Microbacterium capsulatum TaxID=3041921 RepID=UPI003B02CE5D
MSKNEPVDARVRLAISRWPADAPRGAVTSFCREHEISRKTFYVLLARAREKGPAAVLEPQSRRPSASPAKIGEEVKRSALDVRAALERSGLDYGPISVHDKMTSMGFTTPSIASLARIFREAGVARVEPKKKPRSAFRRFVYPAPNACWQLDATEYVLAGGRTCVIFQLTDDHARLAVASHVARAETSKGAVTVMEKGIARHGVPQRLLTDNGAALNPHRRGIVSQLVAYVSTLGVVAITGKPGHPMTQGKNERFHQTLFRWLDKQPLAGTIEELQHLVDRFDVIYNTERPHQALPGRSTPQQAWDATPKAPAPEPDPDAATHPGATGDAVRIVRTHGDISIRGTTFQLGNEFAGTQVHAIWNPALIMIFDERGTLIIIEHPWPQPGTRYVGNGRPRGSAPRRRPLSPMS